jgi:hypothetical protein
MRLIKQSFLYYREGNSDKVYEIDLCEVGNDKYVVNFRYGRRGAQLKEGTKTPVPVTLAEAEKIYDAVETEKLTKGYTASETSVSTASAAPVFSFDTSAVSINTSWAALPHSRTKAILQRLHNAVNGTAQNEKFPWKLSRIIWKAGQYKITEATPYIIHLYPKGNQLHQYSCIWALARCGGDVAVTALQTCYNNHPLPLLSKIAGAGLVKHLGALEKEMHLHHYINRLPEAFKPLLSAEQPVELDLLIQERINQQQPNYNWLEDLYVLATEKRWMRSSIKKVLGQLPLKPNYFKHIRAIYKLSELLDDYEITGLLGCRFEREAEMFVHNFSSKNSGSKELYIPELEEWIKIGAELKKKTSRLAYSQKTKWYLHSRILRRLHSMGNNEDTDYVKLATALLIGYRQKEDFRKTYSTYRYSWNGRNYNNIETRFLQNAQAVFLHQVLSGNHPDIELQANHLWRMRSANDKNSAAKKQTNQSAGSNNDGLGGLIKKFTSLFGKKKLQEQPKEPEAATKAIPNPNGTPFLHIWNKIPQAYVQLLMEAEMEEIHEFAEANLTGHPDYNTIKERLDKQAYKKLLLSPFAIPAKFGFALATERYMSSIPDDDLVTAMLNSVNENARVKGKQWTESYSSTYLQQSRFIVQLIFAGYSDIRQWAKSFLQNTPLPEEIKQSVIIKSVAELMSYGRQTPENETIIKEAADLLFEQFGEEIKNISIEVIADLVLHPNPSVLLTGLRFLKLKRQQLNLNELSAEFVFGLISHSYDPVREEGLSILSAMEGGTLLQWENEVIKNCLSPYENIQNGLPPVIKRMAEKNNDFGIHAAEILMPYLLRKETAEGVHASVSKLLCNELSNYLQNANKETALNLLYSNYSAAQNVGVIILEKYTEPSQLSLPQVVALGGHENLNVREWSWKFYNEQIPRIKYEKDKAIKLLESKWLDSRQFAMQFFRENFLEADWNAETLITLADSVKPDVESFGREMITKFFAADNGTEYLLKLSQHPSEKMQLFATNYLERYAKDDADKMLSLDFYFRSVLTRVNKSRVAKNRIYHFLLTEGRKSENTAKIVSSILSEVSATAAIGDKAKCIEILLQLKSLYEVVTPVKVLATEERRV